MSYQSSKFVVDRINLLRQLVREKDGSSRHYVNDSEDTKSKELNALVRILRPATQQANDHSHAIRLRLRQAILNHPNAGSEGPLLLSRFDKTFETLKRLNPAMNGPILAFLKPLSFKTIVTRFNATSIADAAEENRRLMGDKANQLTLVHASALADPEVVNTIKSLTMESSLPMFSMKQTNDLLPSYKTAALLSNATPTNPLLGQENIVSIANDNAYLCWVTPDVEKKLLIDLVYILQGVTGKHIRYDTPSESYLIDPALDIPIAVRDITLCICELGWLFCRVSNYLKKIFTGATDAHGLIAQAFGFAIQEELQDYYRLLAVLEQEIYRENNMHKSLSAAFLTDNSTISTTANSTNHPNHNVNTRFVSKPARSQATPAQESVGMNLTLLRLKTWMQEPLERMCLMARLVDAADTSHLFGGALASRLHAHTRHGDTQLITSLVQRLMDSVCAPLYAMCIRWMLQGELHDSHQEFFIAVNNASNTNSNKSLWKDAYYLRTELLPMFIPLSLAEKMLNIGRAINFMKLCLQRLPKEKQQYLAYQNTLLKQQQKARRSLRMINKAKKLTLYGRVVDTENEDDDTATVLPEEAQTVNSSVHEIHEKESVASGVSQNQNKSAMVVRKTLSFKQDSSSAAVSTAGLNIDADEQYFFRDAFQDTHPKDIAEALRVLRYSGDLPLSQCILQLSYQIDTRLLQLLERRFHYKQHLSALKRFLLLGQGDFVMCLMDGVAPELKKRANQLYRHNLTAILEGSLRASNAQYDPPYILDRVHVRLLDAAPGDTGWEVFALDYSTDQNPCLQALLHPEAMKSYRIAFHMLWRLKRVEWSLTTTWKMFLSFAHSHEWKSYTLSKAHANVSLLGPTFLAVKSIFHRCNLHRAKMMHFVNNFAAFVMFEVLENSWVTLEESLLKAVSLDGVIEAHDRYLEDILQRALLAPKYENLHMMMQALLQTILRFCSLEETLVADAMALVARQKMLRASADNETAEQPTDSISNTLIMRIDETVRDYNIQFDELMCALKDEAEKNHDFLRYLTFRLDFNGFHQVTSTSSASTSSASTSAAGDTPAVPVVHSVRPGSAVVALSNDFSTTNSSSNKYFYLEKTQPGTSAKMPVHSADVLNATARYK